MNIVVNRLNAAKARMDAARDEDDRDFWSDRISFLLAFCADEIRAADIDPDAFAAAIS